MAAFASALPVASSSARKSAVGGPHPSSARKAARKACRTMSNPPPSSPKIYPQPPARTACPAAFRPYEMEPVPAIVTMPGSPAVAPASAITASSVTTTSSAGRISRRIACLSSGPPLMPKQAAAKRTGAG